MKYNFETTKDRINDPLSTSIKYNYGENTIKRFGFSDNKLPDDIIPLQIADMDYICAPKIIEALKKTAEFGVMGYSAPRASYFEAVQSWFKRHFDWDFATEDIFYYKGTHAGVADAIKKLTNPGAGIIIMCPCYDFHGDVEAQGREYVKVYLNEENAKFSINWDSLTKAIVDPKNEALVLVHPHNPAGIVFTNEELIKMAELCRKNNTVLICDMVHIDILRPGVKAEPIAKVAGPEGIVTMTGLAKTFNIAGLEMSNMIVSDPKLKERLGGHFDLCTPFGVNAAIAAYTECDDWAKEMNDYITRVVDYAVNFIEENLPKAKVTHPDAGFILFIDFSGYGLTSDELNKRISDKAHVLLSNGKEFDGSNLWRRACLTSPLPVIKEALDRLAKAFEDLK